MRDIVGMIPAASALIITASRYDVLSIPRHF